VCLDYKKRLKIMPSILPELTKKVHVKTRNNNLLPIYQSNDLSDFLKRF